MRRTRFDPKKGIRTRRRVHWKVSHRDVKWVWVRSMGLQPELTLKRVRQK